MDVNGGIEQGTVLYQIITKKRIEDNQIHRNTSNKQDLDTLIKTIVHNRPFGRQSNLSAVMFKGLPGTGKTYTAQWVRTKVEDTIGEEVAMLSVNGLQSPDDVTQLFSDARKMATEGKKVIIFDDEAEKYGKRSEIQDPAKTAVLNQYLAELDGINSNSNITVIFATNRPDALDSAFRRGKRVGTEITFDPLDKEGREHMCRIEAFNKDHNFIHNRDYFTDIVSKTKGAVGADMAQVFEDINKTENARVFTELSNIVQAAYFPEEEAESDKLKTSLIEMCQSLNLVEADLTYEYLIDKIIEEKDEFISKCKFADDEHYNGKVGLYVAGKLLEELNPNEEVEKDQEDIPEAKRWMSISKETIDSVLEKFIPSALKDMPYEETDLRFSSLGGLDAQTRYIHRLVKNTIGKTDDQGRHGEGTTIFLYGAEGNGVTSLAKSVAGQFDYNLLVLYGDDQESMWVGQVKDRLLKLNTRAKASQPCIVVFDMIKYLAENTGRTESAHKQTATSALKQIIKPTRGVIYIATGESLNDVDPGVRKLFHRHIEVTAPSKSEHYQVIWDAQINSDLVNSHLDYTALARQSKGLRGGDIHSICRFFYELGVPYTQEKLERVTAEYAQKFTERATNQTWAKNDAALANIILKD